LVGIGQAGRLALEFIRESSSALEAMASALADVKKALPTAQLIEAVPDFVGLTDVAELLGVSRQYMRKIMLGNDASFPAPLHEGNTAIWHLHELLGWICENKQYQVDAALLEVAGTAMQLNMAREERKTDAETRKRIQKLVL